MIKSWQVALATVLIFLAGLVTGGAIVLRVVHVIANVRKQDREASQAQEQAQQPSKFQGQQSHPGGQPEPQFGPQLIRRFAGQLDLTPEQSSRINPIVRRTVSELTRLRRETQLSTALAIERMQDEIAAQLTPPQRAKFEDLLVKQRTHLQQFIEERKSRQGQGQSQSQPPVQSPPLAPPGGP